MGQSLVSLLQTHKPASCPVQQHTTTAAAAAKMPIKRIVARQIYDSRGNPTVEVDLTTDKDKANWHGKGVTKAIANVNDVISPALVKADLDPVEQNKIDDMMLKMDGTDNKNNLGANAILGVSMAVCKAGAAHKGVPLYRHIADLAG